MASEFYRVADLETRVESLTHAVALVVVAFVVGTLATLLVAAGYAAAGLQIQPLSGLPPLPYAVITASQFAGFFVVIGAYLAWRSDREFFQVRVPSLVDAAWVLVGFVGLYLIATVLTVILQAYGVETATNQVIDQGRQDPVRFLYLIPVTVLFVAPAEELLFRGLVQGLFRKAYGVVPAVLLASALFGAPHYLALIGSGSGRLTTVALVTVLGIVLGAVYERTENILVPIAIHAAWNTMSFLVQYYQAT